MVSLNGGVVVLIRDGGRTGDGAMCQWISVHKLVAVGCEPFVIIPNVKCCNVFALKYETIIGVGTESVFVYVQTRYDT